MSNEQKLLHVALEAINALMMGAERYSDNHWGRICMPTDSAMSKGADAAMAIRQAIATTEPEPTGMPELPEPVANVSASSPVGGIGFVKPDKSYFTEDQTRAYGEQCWKAGYKHGAWADKPEPTSKQSLQVEPAVNQQLTTEPFDEREVFEYEMRKRCNWSPNQFIRSPFQHDDYAEQASQDAFEAWQARAAMAKGVKG